MLVVGFRISTFVLSLFALLANNVRHNKVNICFFRWLDSFLEIWYYRCSFLLSDDALKGNRGISLRSSRARWSKAIATNLSCCCCWREAKIVHTMLVSLSSSRLLLVVLIVASLYVSHVQSQQEAPAEEGKLLFAHVVSDSVVVT